MCEKSQCELDTFEQIIRDLRAASPGKVTVLGSVGKGTTAKDYDVLDEKLDGFVFVHTEDYAAPLETFEGKMSVVSLGAPLFARENVSHADVFITLSASAADLGVWNPFSWYPDELPTKWGAIVTDADDASLVATLLDRGYGYIYLTSEPGLDTRSTLTADVLSEMKKKYTGTTDEGRRLERSLTDTSYRWGCDDTLYDCSPICIRTIGRLSTKADESKCTAPPPPACACKCFHDVRWQCAGEDIVCMARFGEEQLKEVGDLVCTMRGTSKPILEELTYYTSRGTSETECIPKPVARQLTPSPLCFPYWRGSTTPEPSEEDYEEEAEDVASNDQIVMESFALPVLTSAAAFALW
jgi:hypothetical protein